eukprot:scaffold30827_cov18-Tisochrysis_lutea.AAC.3
MSQAVDHHKHVAPTPPKSITVARTCILCTSKAAPQCDAYKPPLHSTYDPDNFKTISAQPHPN